MEYNEKHHLKIADSVNYKKFIDYLNDKDTITSKEIIKLFNLSQYFDDDKTDIQMLCDIIIGTASIKSNKFQWNWIFHTKENKGEYPDYKIIWHDEN